MARPNRSTSTPPSSGGDRRVLGFPRGAARRAGGRGRNRIVIGVGASLALVGVLWVALFSPLLAVHSLTITASSDAVRQVAQGAGRAEVGRSVLLVDTTELEALIEQDSRVADATVRRAFPRDLRIEVVARVPVLALEKSEGLVELVDMAGVLVETVEAAPDGVPVVRGGDGVIDGAAVVSALSVVTALPEALRTRVTGLAVDEAGVVSFKVGSTRVTWGDGDDPALKARLVEILLAEKPKAIDVSAPETPTTT